MSLFVDIPSDPIAAFDDWLQEPPKAARVFNAMALATVSADGITQCAHGAVEGHDARGFVLHQSRKQKGQ